MEKSKCFFVDVLFENRKELKSNKKKKILWKYNMLEFKLKIKTSKKL
jgi:hypothetical protein